MEVSCLTSSYCFCNVQLFINPNPNPETAFFQKHKPQPWPHSLEPNHVWGKGGEEWTLTITLNNPYLTLTLTLTLTLKLPDSKKKRTHSDSCPAFFWHPTEIAFILLRNIYLRTKDSDEIIPPFALLSPNLQYRRSAWISSFRTENFLKIIGIDGVNRRFAAKQYVAPKNRTMLREQPIR